MNTITVPKYVKRLLQGSILLDEPYRIKVFANNKVGGEKGFLKEIDKLIDWCKRWYADAIIIENGMWYEKYQGCGIGSKLFQMCCEHISDTMVCESWGKNDVNMKPILEKNGFFMAQDLGDDFYYNNGYCPYCCERGKGCNKCKAQIWVRWKR